MVSFYPDEMKQIEDVELMLLGIQPSELDQMSLQRRYNLIEIGRARESLRNGKMPS